jgi:predicted nucleic acid-binding protein
VIAVSSTSPIINLAAVNRLDLLQVLYPRLLIPQAVYHEIAVAGDGQPGAAEVTAGSWIEVRAITGEPEFRRLQTVLDRGEAEAILLALEVQADLLLMDEKRGRQVAARLGIETIGLLGALLEAKHRGHLTLVRPLLDELIVTAGFWIAEPLYVRVLEAAGES